MIKPMPNHVFLEYINKDESKTASGLIYTNKRNSVKLNHLTRVLSVGKDVEGIKEGDIVIYKWHENLDIDFEGKKCTLVSASKVLCVLENY